MLSTVFETLNKHPLLVHIIFGFLGLGVSSWMAYLSYWRRERMHVFRFNLLELFCVNAFAFISAFHLFKFKHLSIVLSMTVWGFSLLVSTAYFFYYFNAMKIIYNRRYNRYVFHFSRYRLYYKFAYPIIVAVSIMNLLGFHAELYTFIGMLSALIKGVYCAIPMSFLLVFFYQVHRHQASS